MSGHQSNQPLTDEQRKGFLESLTKEQRIMVRKMFEDALREYEEEITNKCILLRRLTWRHMLTDSDLATFVKPPQIRAVPSP